MRTTTNMSIKVTHIVILRSFHDRGCRLRSQWDNHCGTAIRFSCHCLLCLRIVVLKSGVSLSAEYVTIEKAHIDADRFTGGVDDHHRRRPAAAPALSPCPPPAVRLYAVRDSLHHRAGPYPPPPEPDRGPCDRPSFCIRSLWPGRGPAGETSRCHADDVQIDPGASGDANRGTNRWPGTAGQTTGRWPVEYSNIDSGGTAAPATCRQAHPITVASGLNCGRRDPNRQLPGDRC